MEFGKIKIILFGEEHELNCSNIIDAFSIVKEKFGIDVSSSYTLRNNYLLPNSVVGSAEAPPPPQLSLDGPPPPPPIEEVTTNINAVKIDYEYDDGSTKTYFFFGNQDRPETDGAVTSGVPIRASLFYANDLLTANSVQQVAITGSTLIQEPSIKTINKGDTTSKMSVELPNATGVSVYFGFEDRAGIAEYSVYEKGTNVYAVQSGQVDLHSTSDASIVATKGVELVTGLDESKIWVLEIKHTGSANPTVFDSGQDHPIYVGDVQIHRRANSSNSVVEHVSNTNFVNSSFIDDGTQNSLTGRVNYVEFFQVQNEIVNGDGNSTNTFRIKSSTLNVRSVEIDNGRGYRELDKNIDWIVTQNSVTNPFDRSVVLSFVPKRNAAIRIIYDQVSSLLTRKIELTQPQTYDGRLDRYTNIYVQNEAVYVELNQDTTA